MKRVHIVFDGPPGPVSPGFVETEDEEGHGIKLGEWAEHDVDGLWRLSIPDPRPLEALLRKLLADCEGYEAEVRAAGAWDGRRRAPDQVIVQGTARQIREVLS